jgi:hypothetical protein
MDCAAKENIVTQKTISLFKSYLLMEFLGIVQAHVKVQYTQGG